MRRKALTLTEVLTGLAILSILAGVMTLNSATVGQQTARREAERVAVFLQTHILRANLTRDVLWLTVDNSATPNTITAATGKASDTLLKTETLEAREKCSFSPALKLVHNFNLIYRTDDNTRDHTKISADASIDIGPVMASEGNDIPGWYRLTVKGADEKYCNVLISK